MRFRRRPPARIRRKPRYTHDALVDFIRRHDNPVGVRVWIYAREVFLDSGRPYLSGPVRTFEAMERKGLIRVLLREPGWWNVRAIPPADRE